MPTPHFATTPTMQMATAEYLDNRVNVQPNSGSPREVQNKVLMGSTIYREFLAKREEILKHKWIESEKAGYDIGFERALVDWNVKYSHDWYKWMKEQREKREGDKK